MWRPIHYYINILLLLSLDLVQFNLVLTHLARVLVVLFFDLVYSIDRVIYIFKMEPIIKGLTRNLCMEIHCNLCEAVIGEIICSKIEHVISVTAEQ